MKPVVLFVHGAWHSPIHFGPICSLLQKYGYKTSCPRLPTAGGSIHAGLPEDAETIAAELERLLACGADVFLVGHSYGGVVITDAVLPEHTKTARAAKGLQGGVVHILYLSALLLPPGQTISDVLGGQLPPFLSIDEKAMCRLDHTKFEAYIGLSPDDQTRWKAELQPFPVAAFFADVTNVGHHQHPSTYLYATNDQVIPHVLQQAMVKWAVDAGGKIRTETCNSDHSPYLTQPDTVVKLIEAIVMTN